AGSSGPGTRPAVRGARGSARPTVRLDRAGSVATITLDRPDKLNALSPREHRQLQKILAELREDFMTRVVILTGTGRAFSAGADLANKREDGKPRNDLERRHRARIGDRTVAAIDALDQVTICAINGLCVGGGAVLALACDLRVMARDAWLSIPEVTIGMPLTWGALPLLLREVGPSRTIELVTTCDRVSAEQALDLRLVNHVVADAVQKAREIAAKIAAQPAVPIAMTKTTVRALRSSVARGDVTASDGDLYWLAIRLGGLTVDGPPNKRRPRA
ncbi:MAG: enoyl-CoA hydratase/isomerase family protein, partial [Deltaproteobacteria bacterium]|nr:enoyl-CoA hydratase/isomerase family protein [Deltaproteobacteria bacterium]